MLNERQVLKNIRLSDIQKEVLAMVQAAPNEDVAADQVLEKGRNYVGAKNLLVRLGLMTFHDNEATITQTGMEVMRRTNLIDETGQLTDEGQKYAYPDDEEGQQQQGQQQQQPPGGGMNDLGGGMGDDEQNVDQGPLAGTGPGFGEGFSLIKQVQEELEFKRQLRKFTENFDRPYSNRKELQQAYERGKSEAGKKNPYDPKSKEAMAWAEGADEAKKKKINEVAGMDYTYSNDSKEQTAYEDGFEAGAGELGRHRNPFHKRNRLHKAWLDGYDDGWNYFN